MANKVYVTDYFESRYKRFSKKFPALDDELAELADLLEHDPHTGEPLGSGIYKVQLASKDKGKGKSGGFRVITYVVRANGESNDIHLITIYDKSEESSINKAELAKLVKKIME